MINLGRCNRSCKALDNLSSRIYAPNKTDKVNLNSFNLIAGMNRSKKKITKHICCNYRCRDDGRK